MIRTAYRAIGCIFAVWMAFASSVPAQVVINEVRCRAGAAAVRNGEDPARLEFIEIYNPGALSADLSGWSIMGAAQVAFPSGTFLEPGEYLVAARDPAFLKEHVPGISSSVPIVGWTGGGVPGGNVLLLDASGPRGTPVDGAACDGVGPLLVGESEEGASLELVNPKLHGASPRAWRPSSKVPGTPGTRNSRFTEAPILIDEKPARRMSSLRLAQVSVTFSEEVENVRASDLTLDGVPAVSVEGTGAGPYLFAVAPPASVRVRVALQGGAIENLDGFAFVGDSWEYVNAQATVLSMPDTATGGPGAAVQVPIAAVPGDGILGIDMTLNYDPAVILASNATVSGIAASAGFALIRNLNTPGVIIISMYATQSAMSGSGEIARIDFNVLGTPGATSALAFSYASVNEGSIPAVLDNGLFTVTCAGAQNGTACNDGNACTANDQCLNGTCTGTPIPAPGEIANLRFGADGMTLAWDPAGGAGPETLYDIVRGLLAGLPVGPGGGDETCLGESLAVTALVDATGPPAGGGFWYLVRGENACGKGTYGFQGQNGVPTVARTTTTCP